MPYAARSAEPQVFDVGVLAGDRGVMGVPAVPAVSAVSVAAAVAAVLPEVDGVSNAASTAGFEDAPDDGGWLVEESVGVGVGVGVGAGVTATVATGVRGGFLSTAGRARQEASSRTSKGPVWDSRGGRVVVDGGGGGCGGQNKFHQISMGGGVLY